MERSLSAYTDLHIQRYFDDVKHNGLKEHGFPRLTANIGILIAHGRRKDLMPIFLEMMEFCCKTIPTVKVANDFSVREIVCCISELERSGMVSVSTIEHWKRCLCSIDPYACYDIFARTQDDRVKNWALFTALSEFFRMRMGLGGSEEFIDIQLATQLRWIDENGMYMDGEGDKHHPIMYDIVPRGLFALLLCSGYRGRYYTEIDNALRKAGVATLKMQSPNGEIAFGGRSNQFLHNEPWMLCIYAYEVHRYLEEGNIALAKEFGAAIKRALNVTEKWLSVEPILHIKNRFPTKTKFGCEEYAYFDKYMITIASNLYAAYLICEDAIFMDDIPDHRPSVFATSEHFHKLFVKAGGYGLEFDLDADLHYDACGLGRIHFESAPSPICLSLPCSSNPTYTVHRDDLTALSLCPGIIREGKWVFATDPDTKHTVTDLYCDGSSAYAEICSQFFGATNVVAKYTVNSEGVKIQLKGDSDIAYMLPAFYYDGEGYSVISKDDNSLSIRYNGWICRYVSDGKIFDTKQNAANRNGYYKVFFTSSNEKLNITVQIIKV